VLVNKMDLVKYDRNVFNSVVEEYKKFLVGINLKADFVPVSGMEGDTVAKLTDKMPWYKGNTVLEVLDTFQKEPHPVDKPFRMPVQDVYKFTKGQDKRRIIVGSVQTGSIDVGDEVVFYPSGKKSTVKSVETFGDNEPNPISAGWASAFTLDQQIYVSRGQIATKAGQKPPKITNTLRVNLFWMGKRPMIKDKDYLIKVGTAKEHVRLKEVIRVIDASELNSSQNKDRIEHHDVGECILHVKKAIAFDLAEQIAVTGRFVIVDDFEICGGGIIREALKDDQLWIRDYVMTRNYKWETGDIPRDDRAEKYSQKPTLILITGQKDVGKKILAKATEARLFTEGKIIYFLGIGNILYGIDADIKTAHDSADIKKEHLRRLAEVANVMLDAGIILIVTAIGLTQDDLELITAAVDIDSINVVWIGDEPSDISYDMLVQGNWELDDTVDSIKKMLQTKGVIFKP
jgi:bifunctional enzyme CysN/CysC